MNHIIIRRSRIDVEGCVGDDGGRQDLHRLPDLYRCEAALAAGIVLIFTNWKQRISDTEPCKIYVGNAVTVAIAAESMTMVSLPEIVC